MEMQTTKKQKSKQDWGTPPDFKSAVERRFGPLAWDLACHDDGRNSLTDTTGMFGPTVDSLKQDWHKIEGGYLWLNPPYADIAPWARKCKYESSKGAKILMLTPASVDSNWFRESCLHQCLTLALNPRIKFVGANAGYNKPLMLTVWGHDVITDDGLPLEDLFDQWRWK